MKKYIICFLAMVILSRTSYGAAPSFHVSQERDGDINGTMTFLISSNTADLISGSSYTFYFDHTPITGGIPGSPSMTFKNDYAGCNTITNTSTYNSQYLIPTETSVAVGCSGSSSFWTTHITVNNLKIPSGGWPGGTITCEYDMDSTGKQSCGSITVPAFQPRVSSCTATSEALTVSMGDVKNDIFIGQGSTSSAVSFNLSMHCNANTKVYTTITGPVDASNTAGVLALTSGSGGAAGVGIQIRYNNQPVQLGALMHLQDVTSESDISIPFQAMYYQTGGEVTSGQANSTATFTMTYQ